MTIVINMLVIFALLLAAGYTPYAAVNRARTGVLTEQDLKNLDAAGLPLSNHATDGHTDEKYNVRVIQQMLRMGICSPKVYYTGANGALCANKRVLMGCKISSTSTLWALLVIGFKDWWRPTIVTGYAMMQNRLDATAAKNGCKTPGLYMP